MPQQTDNLQWVSLQDFSPGIYSRTGTYGTVAAPAPLGAAQVTNTYRCVSLPGGGLGPLPARVADWGIANPEAVAPTSGYWIVGFFSFGPQSIGVGGQTAYFDSLFVSVAYQVAGGQQRHRLYQIRTFETGTPVSTLKLIDSGYTSTNYFEPATFCSSRMNSTDPTMPGTPVVVTCWYTPGGASDLYVSTFPDPSTAGVTAMFDLSTSRHGDVIGHQGRVVLAEWTAYAFGTTGGMQTNEQISFTDPANSITLGSQQEVFAQEYPNGYGAWGSISAGELFLVKHQGGGVIISGDIANPSITRLPGVVSTGGMISNHAASTPSGLFYASQYDGVYSWRGGDTSQKVSLPLDDNFLAITNMPSVAGGALWNAAQQVSFEAWGDWVVATHNYLFDIMGGGWWRLEDPDLVDLVYWSRGFNSKHLHGATNYFAQDAASIAHTWDRATPSTSWSWQSHPIPATIDRLTEVREMVLLAQGTGTVTVTLTGIDPAGADTTRAEVFTVTHTAQPQRLRPAVGGTFIKGYNVMARIQSDGGSAAAPVVYALHLGTRQAQQATNT